VRTPRQIAALTAREALGGHVLNAGVLGAVESANWGMTRLGRWLPPRVRCSCCGWAGRSFLHVHNRLRTAWNSACPQCDSRSRHRGLAILIPELLAERSPARVLHVSPEIVLRRAVEPLAATYDTSDYADADVTYPREDLTNPRIRPQSYDVILCNHVLEHIEDDAAAVAGLAGILVRDGLAVITIPGIFTRRETVRFPDNSLNGHWRDYGNDVVDTFARFFEQVERVDLSTRDHAADGLSHGIRRGEVAFVLSSPRAVPS
jgi:SAM-dependent methyltransferase